MSDIPVQVKLAIDTAAGLTPPSLFIATLNGWLTILSLVMSFLASLVFFLWTIHRWRSKPK